MAKCYICKYYDSKKMSLFRIPNRNDEYSDRPALWLKLLGEKKENINRIRICSQHFLKKKPSKADDYKDIDWVPNQNLGQYSKNRKCVEHYMRSKKTIQPQNNSKEMDESNGSSPVPVKKSKIKIIEQKFLFPKGIQTNLTGEEIDYLFAHYQNVVEERDNLLLKISTLVIDVEFFKDDDQRTRFYTGLPTWRVLNRFFKLVESYLPEHGNCKLSPFQMLVLTIMKLRLNLLFTDLGYRFQINGNTASNYFHRTIYILHKLFFGSKMIHWPEDRVNLLQNTPSYFRCCFKEKITIIVDCFEIFIERSSILRALAQTFSQYKHHVTIKFLIGISTTGAIIFVSEAFGKEIVLKSKFLDKLLEGDLVLADKGFLIEGEVKDKNATLRIPCFVRNVDQLDPKDVEETRHTANIRIHVERLISVVRQKYNICADIALMSAISKENDMFHKDLYDKIVFLCCCFVNMCPSVVKNDFEM